MNVEGKAVTKYITGWALRRILENGPTAKYYMGLESRGQDYIYDVAYNSEEVKKIGMKVSKGMKIETSDVSFGALSPHTAASLYYVADRIKFLNKGQLKDGNFYTVEYTSAEEERTESMNQWCVRVKGRKPKDLNEKLVWYREYGGRTEE